MDKTLFNIHDLTLLVIAFECLAIVIYLAMDKAVKTTSSYLLMAFFVVHACISLHELILWGHTFRYWVLDMSPNLFFVLNASYWLDGPLLYLFVRSLSRPDIKLKLNDTVHLLPAFFFCVFITLHFYTLPFDIKVNLIKHYSFADFQYVLVDFLAKLSRVMYLGLALYMLLKAQHAGRNERHSPDWLPGILMAFGAILAWEMTLSSLKVYHSLFPLTYYDIVEFIGLTDYYALFLLMNTLIFLWTRSAMAGNQPRTRTVKKEPVSQDYVNKIEQAMQEDKLYLNQYLSFERLAEKLNIPVKELSLTINRHYNVNFYEFINAYRIEEARRLLADTSQSHRSITEIFYDAGFNSKSVYNTLFKKKFELTPSQYRKQFSSD